MGHPPPRLVLLWALGLTLALCSRWQKPKDLLDPGLCSRSYTAGGMLGAELRRGRRRLSSSLQVPPWKPLDRARSPEPDSVQRPTTLPLRIPPRIAITHAEPDR